MKRALLACLLAAHLGAHADDMPVVLDVVGDVMLAEGPGQLVARGADPLAPFGPTLRGADLRVANLECVIATVGQPVAGKPFTFRAQPAAAGIVARHFDAVSVANNHTGDYGPDAFAQMLGLLDGAGVRYFGGGLDLRQAHAPLIVERRGLRIALLGYDEFFPRHFEADQDKPGVAWSEDEQVERDIRAARTVHHADLVIPFMHWGVEHEPLANARQRQLARLMIAAGADAVIGSHPHVTQDAEQYLGKPIIYSLGNFVFDGFKDEDNNTGWLLRLELDRDGVRGWRTIVARIDAQGVPVPHPQQASPCWTRGDARPGLCKAAP